MFGGHVNQPVEMLFYFNIQKYNTRTICGAVDENRTKNEMNKIKTQQIARR